MSNNIVEALMVIKIPLFRHVHIVTVDKMGIIKCKCSEYEFCVCQICVAQYVHDFAGLDFPGFD